MQFLISRDLTFNVSPGCEGNVSSVACAHLHSFPKLKSSQIPMGPKGFFSILFAKEALTLYLSSFLVWIITSTNKKEPYKFGSYCLLVSRVSAVVCLLRLTNRICICRLHQVSWAPSMNSLAGAHFKVRERVSISFEGMQINWKWPKAADITDRSLYCLLNSIMSMKMRSASQTFLFYNGS